MGDNSGIEWTDATWNPIVGCSVLSPGCTNCYAMKLAGTRLADTPAYAGLTVQTKAGPVWSGQLRLRDDVLTQPLRWSRPRRIFVNSMGDLFHDDVPDEWIDKVFAIMALAPQHTFQVLTKRAERMRKYCAKNQRNGCGLDVALGGPLRAEWEKARREDRDLPAFALPLPNVWLGVSAEDQTRADERIPELLATPAAVRFVSVEPMVGPVDLAALSTMRFRGAEVLNALSGALAGMFGDPCDGRLPPLDWVITGGESGPGARPMHPDWARRIRDDCAAAGVAFCFKQWGEWTPGENVERKRGAVQVASLVDDAWAFETENLADTDGHVDDEPDLYRIGKFGAGRRLDGVTHDGRPRTKS